MSLNEALATIETLNRHLKEMETLCSEQAKQLTAQEAKIAVLEWQVKQQGGCHG